MSHADLYKTEPDPQSGFTSQSVRAMQEEEEEVMEGGRTDVWGELWQLLKEETLGLPGTRLVLQLQTQTRTHTLPDFTQINTSIFSLHQQLYLQPEVRVLVELQTSRLYTLTKLFSF